LYAGTRQRVGLRHKRLTTLFKQQQIIRHDLLRSSRDTLTTGVYNVIRARELRFSSRRFQPASTLEAKLTRIAAESAVRPARLGVGAPAPALPLRKQVTRLVQEDDSSVLLDHLSTLQVQGRWLAWADCMSADMSWGRVLRSGTTRGIIFAVNATADTLPTRPNLSRWGRTEISRTCPLCGLRSATIGHVLNHCPPSLMQGRYTWRHDSVLAAIIDVILERLRERRRPDPVPGFVSGGTLMASSSGVSVTLPQSDPPPRPAPAPGFTSFRSAKAVVETAPPAAPVLTTDTPSSSRPRPRLAPNGTLDRADDWVLLHDLGGDLVVPSFLHPGTRQRPDLLLYSSSSKIVVLGELTCPQEHRVVVSSELKTARYLKLRDEIAACGWTVELFTFEVTSRGYTAPSLTRFFRSLGIVLPRSRLDVIGQVSLMCSYAIYLHRECAAWVARPLLSDSFGEIQGQQLRSRFCACLAAAAASVLLACFSSSRYSPPIPAVSVCSEDERMADLLLAECDATGADSVCSEDVRMAFQSSPSARVLTAASLPPPARSPAKPPGSKRARGTRGLSAEHEAERGQRRRVSRAHVVFLAPSQ
jgi:hypothetical protein